MFCWPWVYCRYIWPWAPIPQTTCASHNVALACNSCICGTYFTWLSLSFWGGSVLFLGYRAWAWWALGNFFIIFTDVHLFLELNRCCKLKLQILARYVPAWEGSSRDHALHRANSQLFWIYFSARVLLRSYTCLCWGLFPIRDMVLLLFLARIFPRTEGCGLLRTI